MDIQINQLKKSFGEKTVVNIDNLHIKEGEMLGLVGNNGAGKTTLFRLMLDLLKADEGNVSLGDIDPTSSEQWKDETGSYIDEGFLIDFLTPEEYFDFIGKVYGTKVDMEDELIQQLMAGEILGQKKLIRDLSAGNKQKVGIIAAMLGNPRLLVLDEPFNFLDPSSQNVLKKLLTRYNERTGATILVSSHNLQHTIEISTRITLMEHGVIVKDLDNTNQAAEQELEAYFKV